MDPDTGEATDSLQPQVIKMFEELGTNCTTVSQVIETEDKAVFKSIQDGIDRYNTQHIISTAQRVWNILRATLQCICIKVPVDMHKWTRHGSKYMSTYT